MKKTKGLEVIGFPAISKADNDVNVMQSDVGFRMFQAKAKTRWKAGRWLRLNRHGELEPVVASGRNLIIMGWATHDYNGGGGLAYVKLVDEVQRVMSFQDVGI